MKASSMRQTVLLFAFLAAVMLMMQLSGTTAASSQGQFLGNSQQMLDEVCNASPPLIRTLVRRSILKELGLRAGDTTTTISEDQLIRATKLVTPSKYQANTMKIINKYKS